MSEYRHERSEVAPSHAQVVICGAGPVGLFTGIVLALHSIHVHILEALPQISESPRAVAYQPAVLAELIETGVYEDLRAVATESNGLSYWTGEGPRKTRLALIPKLEGVRGVATGLNCGQPTLARVLLHRLRMLPTAQVTFDARIMDFYDDGSLVYVSYESAEGEHSQLTCDWLVGADGSRSTTRKLAGIEFEGFTWPKEEFVATNVVYPFADFGFTSGNFLLHPVHWAVVAAIEPAKGLWRIAYGIHPEITDEELRAEIPERFTHFLPDPTVEYELLQVNRYKPHQRCAAQLRKGRLLLAGDAAHSNNPIGGLGLTSGLLDAGPLGRALAAVVQGRAPDSLLDRWAKLRHQSWWEYTNPQSIEHKRIMQRGGHGYDPAGIWAHDAIADEMDMTRWLQNATPGAKERDDALFEIMQDERNQLRARARTWDAALPVDWMADYETSEVVGARRLNRPQFD